MPTKIEWATETWNVAPGCFPVSEGCENCCALRDVHRMRLHPNPKISAPLQNLVSLKEDGRPQWTGLQIHRYDLLKKPLHWRKPRRVFVNYLGDLFLAHTHFLDEVFAVMTACEATMLLSGKAEGHIFYVLTKRPKRAMEYLHAPGTRDRFFSIAEMEYLAPVTNVDWPLRNVCIGITAENQARFDERWRYLRQIPAARYLVSHEPALGPINYPADFLALGGRAGVITGGETGKNARPMDPNWAYLDRQQCDSSGVKFFFKQWGKWADPVGAVDSLYHYSYADIPYDDTTCCYRVGKRRAGRVIEGRTWNEMP